MASAALLRFLLVLLCFMIISQNSDGQETVWCIADEQAGDDILLGAMNWACGQGGANCSMIQENQPCYLPNTVKDHASYAFNKYYQQFRSKGAYCYFNGAGMITELDPSYGSCKFEILP